MLREHGGYQVEPTTPGVPTLQVPSLSTLDPLSLEHQQCFFTGWGDRSDATNNLKTPSLGLKGKPPRSTNLVHNSDLQLQIGNQFSRSSTMTPSAPTGSPLRQILLSAAGLITIADYWA